LAGEVVSLSGTLLHLHLYLQLLAIPINPVPSQLTENIGALSVLEKLTPDIIAQIHAIADSTPEVLSNAEKMAAAGRGVGTILGT
jgi:hypothetical protein